MTVIPELPVADCLPWCAGHPERHLSPTELGDEWGHSWRIAEGQYTDHYGPLYAVTVDRTKGGVRLWVSVESGTLTADQAEVLARAVLDGAQALRASGDLAARDVIQPCYEGVRGWVYPPNLVPTPTEAERAAHSARGDGL